MLKTIEDARAIVAEASRPSPMRLRSEQLFLEASPGRILAEDIIADRDQPPFHRSMRDGYAVRAEEAQAGVQLQCVGEVPAGSCFDGELKPGQCIAIMTGAPLPKGADAVVMIEDVQVEGAKVKSNVDAKSGQYFVPQGAELRKGTIAIAKGTRVHSGVLQMMATVGCTHPKVHCMPRVAIIPSGSEIVPIDQAPGNTQIRNSNMEALASLCVNAGGIPLRLPICGDTKEELRASIDEAIARADIIVINGGISKGKYDLVAEVLSEMGGEFLFRGVALRPGKPVAFGTINQRQFLCLPGNPLSAAITFSLFGKLAIETRCGRSSSPLNQGMAIMGEDYRQNKMQLRHFAPATLHSSLDGTKVHPLSSQGSGDVATFAKADAFINLAPGVEEVPAGASVPILILD